MADYKSIHGVRVVGYTADPDNIIEGQIWFDKTASTVQYEIPVVSTAWRAGNDMNTAREALAEAGIQTAALGFGGGAAPKQQNESYDGTSWTETGDLNTGRSSLMGAGTQTAALAIGGYVDPTTDVVESWDGSSWTEVGDLNTARSDHAADGTSTSAIAFGGFVHPGTTDVTETWNGSSWTEVGDLNTPRWAPMGVAANNTAAGILPWSYAM